MGKKPEEEELTSKLLAEDETILVASPKAPWLPSMATYDLDTLMGLPWVMRTKGSATRMVLENALALTGHTLQNLNIRCKGRGNLREPGPRRLRGGRLLHLEAGCPAPVGEW